MSYHIIAFVIGYLLDLLIGDPHSFPHPVRLMGRLIVFLENKLNSKDSKRALNGGILCVVIACLSTLTVTTLLIVGTYYVNIYLGIVVESVMTYQILSTRCLKDESMRVYERLCRNDLEGARFVVSMIVGRDTKSLDDKGIIKAAVETVAENTSDGVIAPMIYTAAFGPILGFLYKMINTMDSMIGYKNDKYLYFGRAAAKLDDFVNFIPSRISAHLLIMSTYLAGKEYDSGNAVKIYKRDNRNHASPNSAQTESVCAGALSVRLAGPASYFGRIVEKPYIGDDIKSIENEDIKRVNRLMYIASFICAVICVSVLLLICILIM